MMTATEEKDIYGTLNAIAVAVCIICAGLASGLTQGLMSLDYNKLVIKSRSGTTAEMRQAKSVLPLLSNHHFLLVSLMLWNASATEILPIYLNKLVPEYAAIIMSVTLVLFLGEILPASILTGPNQLFICSSLRHVVYAVFIIFSPVAYPISYCLDYFLGQHHHSATTISRLELSTMVKLQQEEHESRKKLGARVGADEVTDEEIAMIEGVLKFSQKIVNEVMNVDIFMLNINDKLDFETLTKIFKSGYSRIPIYERDQNDITGLILVKDLIFIDPEDEIPLRSFLTVFSRPLPSVWPDQKLDEVLRLFRSTGVHMAIVRDVVSYGTFDPSYQVIGIITLEDLFEKILGEEILDETDILDENNRGIKNRNRDLELSKMTLLNNKMFSSLDRTHLNDVEIQVVAAYIKTNYQSIFSLFLSDTDCLMDYLSQCNIVEVIRFDTENHEKIVSDKDIICKTRPGNIIYQRGIKSDLCLLILSGKMTIISGRDEFKLEIGSWTLLGLDSFIGEPEYTPDFTGYIQSKSVKYLEFRHDIIEEVKLKAMERERERQRQCDEALSSLECKESDIGARGYEMPIMTQDRQVKVSQFDSVERNPILLKSFSNFAQQIGRSETRSDTGYRQLRRDSVDRNEYV